MSVAYSEGIAPNRFGFFRHEQPPPETIAAAAKQNVDDALRGMLHPLIPVLMPLPVKKPCPEVLQITHASLAEPLPVDGPGRVLRNLEIWTTGSEQLYKLFGNPKKKNAEKPPKVHKLTPEGWRLAGRVILDGNWPEDVIAADFLQQLFCFMGIYGNENATGNFTEYCLDKKIKDGYLRGRDIAEQHHGPYYRWICETPDNTSETPIPAGETARQQPRSTGSGQHNPADLHRIYTYAKPKPPRFS